MNLIEEAIGHVDAPSGALDEAGKTHIDALLALGTLLRDQGETEAALHAHERARAMHGDAHRGLRAARVSRELAKSLQARGRMDEAIDALTKAIEVGSDVAQDETTRSRVGLVELLELSGRHEEAWARAEALLDDERVGAQPDAAVALRRRAADALLSLGRHDDALRLLEDAIELAAQHQDRKGLAGSECSRGRLLRETGDLGGALQAYGHALEQFRALGDDSGAAAVLTNQALIQLDLGHLPQAERSVRESLALATETGNLRVQAGVRRVLAGALQRRGKLDEAAGHAQRAIDLALQLGAHLEARSARIRLGKIQCESGRLDEAIGSFDEALRDARASADRVHEAFALEGLARTHVLVADFERGREAVETGLELARALKQEELNRKLHETAAQVYEGLDDLRRSLRHQRRAHEIALGRAERSSQRHLDMLLHERELEDARQRAALAEERARRRSAERIRTLNRRLIRAQEAEQRRIGRDLHDDLGQRLAVLTLELREMTQDVKGRSSEDRERARRVLHKTQSIASDVAHISHQMHPAALEHLGLAGALRGLCREVGEQSGVAIECETRDPLPSTPPEVALGVFRIVQEALRNVVRHSQAEAAAVKVTEEAGDIIATIQDEGVGMPRDGEDLLPGLGLISMRERAALEGGSLTIDSAPGKGTTIRVRLPANTADRH